MFGRAKQIVVIYLCAGFLGVFAVRPAQAQKAFIEGACGTVSASIYVERFPGADVIFVARCEPSQKPCATVYAGSAKGLCLKEQNVGVTERGAKITFGVVSFFTAGTGLVAGVLGRAKDVAFVAHDTRQLSQEIDSGKCATTAALLQIASVNGTAKEKESCAVGELLHRLWQLNLDKDSFDRTPIISHSKGQTQADAKSSDRVDYVIEVIENDAFRSFKAMLESRRDPSSLKSSKGKSKTESQKKKIQ